MSIASASFMVATDMLTPLLSRHDGLGRVLTLLKQLAKTPVTHRSFAPRRVLKGGERVEYADLKWRAERFGFLVLVRPNGYLVTALDGTPLQRQGPLELVEGEWRVGRFVVVRSILERAQELPFVSE